MNAGIRFLQNYTAYLPIPAPDKKFLGNCSGYVKTEIFKSRNCLVVKVASNLLFTVKTPEEDYPHIVET